MLCLMALFLFGVMLLVLLFVLPLGGYQLLVRLVVWLLLILILLVVLGMRLLVWEFFQGSRSGPGGKRFRLNRKTPAHLVKGMVQSRPRAWKRLHHVGFFRFFTA